MKFEVAKEKLAKNIAAKDRPILHGVLVRDGFAYAFDGKIAARVAVDGEGIANDTPIGFPAGAMVEIFETAERYFGKWYRFNEAKYAGQFKALKKELAEHREEAKEEDRYRYVREECPCCGEEVYYDRDFDRLVREMEPPKGNDVEMRDLHHPVRLVFEQKEIYVNFGFIATTVSTFGDRTAFAIQGKGCDALVLFKAEGGVFGVLKPLAPDKMGDLPRMKMEEVAE